MTAMRISMLVVLAGLLQSSVLAQQASYGFPAKPRRINANVFVVGGYDSGTPEENELVSMCQSMGEAYDAYHREAEKVAGAAERLAFYEVRDPANEFIPKLLDFEEREHGTFYGLMALRQVVRLANLGGRVSNVRDQGRRDAIGRLPAYRGHAEILAVLESIPYGNFEPATESLLRSFSQDPNADPRVREFSRFMWARWALYWRDAREDAQHRLLKLGSGSEREQPLERKLLQEQISAMPSVEQLHAWEEEAIAILRGIANSEEDHRAPTYKFVDDPWGHMTRVDEGAMRRARRLSEHAGHLLFQETHLRVGCSAPDIAVQLVSGGDWRLQDQRGRVVVVQFSFKGCRPCEAMYPDLRQIQEENGERVSVLSIMADAEREKTENAVSEGKLTWNVHWDGRDGPLATRWQVTAFPTVYVIDRQGRIAAVGLYGEELAEKVAELLN